jgi:hypothetical protein
LRCPAASASRSSLRASRRAATSISRLRILSSSEQVGHQRAFLAQGAPRGARGGISASVSGLASASVCIRRRPMSLSFHPGEAAHFGQVVLFARRVAGNVGQGFVAHDAPARDVLVHRLGSRHAASARRRPSTAGLRLGGRIFSQTLPGSLR